MRRLLTSEALPAGAAVRPQTFRCLRPAAANPSATACLSRNHHLPASPPTQQPHPPRPPHWTAPRASSRRGPCGWNPTAAPCAWCRPQTRPCARPSAPSRADRTSSCARPGAVGERLQAEFSNGVQGQPGRPAQLPTQPWYTPQLPLPAAWHLGTAPLNRTTAFPPSRLPALPCRAAPTFLCCADSQKGRNTSAIAAASPCRASSPASHVSTHSMERRGTPSAGGASPKCTSGPA